MTCALTLGGTIAVPRIKLATRNRFFSVFIVMCGWTKNKEYTKFILAPVGIEGKMG
jgi:hypothetical protein